LFLQGFPKYNLEMQIQQRLDRTTTFASGTGPVLMTAQFRMTDRNTAEWFAY